MKFLRKMEVQGCVFVCVGGGGVEIKCGYPEGNEDVKLVEKKYGKTQLKGA